MKKIILVLFVLISVGCGNTISDEIPDGAFIDIKLDDIEVFSEVYVSDLIIRFKIRNMCIVLV